ncbi:MAG: hypothetical protein IPM82_01305 [Saprospiraceae bacterium]|nr:hypothetical protein [Saprospiraceae bacterium]
MARRNKLKTQLALLRKTKLWAARLRLFLMKKIDKPSGQSIENGQDEGAAAPFPKEKQPSRKQRPPSNTPTRQDANNPQKTRSHEKPPFFKNATGRPGGEPGPANLKTPRQQPSDLRKWQHPNCAATIGQHPTADVNFAAGSTRNRAVRTTACTRFLGAASRLRDEQF